MPRARNGIRYPSAIKSRAESLRAEGLTHREIAKKLGASISIVHSWTKGTRISESQKRAIEKRRKYRRMTATERRIIGKRLAPYRMKYTADDLLTKIRDFYAVNGRIPLKREFNSWDVFAAKFGSWNNAIKEAGFETNPILFSKRFTAIDGHICDSFTEKIIDDWLTRNSIGHERHFRYGNTKFTADFKIDPNIFIEFFGLAGVQKRYDENIEKKRQLAEKLGYQLIEVYPDDIYPSNKLETKLSVIA